jgi:hypothetical protein
MARPKSIGPVVASKEFTVNPAEVDAAVSLDVTATVAGLKVGYPVRVWAPDLEADLVICNEHCSAADTLTFRLVNVTALAINPASQTMYVVQD